ncbi:hypothetical protein GQX74_012044 [Glossina fuscipes]|nr:hypothetical protein GQX74_012044 [Glossina fuscipes]
MSLNASKGPDHHKSQKLKISSEEKLFHLKYESQSCVCVETPLSHLSYAIRRKKLLNRKSHNSTTGNAADKANLEYAGAGGSNEMRKNLIVEKLKIKIKNKTYAESFQQHYSFVDNNK